MSTATARSDGKLTTALVLGIIGGVFGILAGLLALMVGGIGAAFEAEGSGITAGLGFAAILLGVVGIVGGALARGKPVVAAWLQLAAGVLGVIAVSVFWSLSAILFVIGALMAFLGRKAVT